MVNFTEIGNKFDEIKENLIKLNLKSSFEHTFLHCIVFLYMILIPIWGFLAINSFDGWWDTFDVNNAGYLMAGILLVLPYFANLGWTLFTALTDPGKYLSSTNATIPDLRYILKLDTNYPQKLFLDSIYNVIGASVSSVLIIITSIPLLSPSTIVWVSIISMIMIFISILLWFMSLIYIMKYAMFKPRNDPNYEFKMV